MNDAHLNLFVGQAAVHRVVSELLLRGTAATIPVVDVGVDLHTVEGCRIQVKTVKLRKNSATPKGAYWFKFWQSPVLSGAKNIKLRGARDYSKCCDMMVLWGRDEDRFWIIPTALLGSTQCLLLGPKGFYQRAEFDESTRLKAEGLTQQEIADRLGITQAAVSYQLRGGRSKRPEETMSSKARAYEGRWDLIVDFGKAEAAESAEPDTLAARQ